MGLFSVIVATTIGIVVCTSFHYEALRWIDFVFARRSTDLRWVPVILTALIGAHLLEIGCYAVIFALAAGPLHLGSFRGGVMLEAFDYYYFAAETYSSLGYGDIVPTGPLRLLASVEPLNGMLLLAWSGSYLFGAVTRGERVRRRRGAS